MKEQQRTTAGFTLLEVMVAVAILAIALTSLFGSQSASVSLAAETRFNIQAPLLARMKLAEFQAAQEPMTGMGDFGDDFSGFTWELSTEEAFLGDSEVMQPLEGKLQQLTVTIHWGDELYSYQIDTYVKVQDEDEQ